MKPVFQVTLCLSLLAAALPGAALAAEEFSRAGLIFWLKGDAGITKDAANKITEWKDQSAAGNHATNADVATAPVFTTEGGQSFAHFDAAAGNFLTISKPLSATNFTVVAAIRFGVSPTPKFTYWLGGDSGQGCYAGGGGNWGGLALVGWGMFRGTGEGYPWLVTSAAAPTDLGVISITNKHLYRNLLDVGLPYPYQKQPYRFGDYIPGIEFNILGANGSKQYFTGDIFEVLVFNQSLTNGERGKVESYLMSRYNVAKPDLSPGVEVGPTGRSGLALWLKADAGITKDAANKITEWKDQSGAGHHATNADAATAPVFASEGGRSFARFDKTNWLNCAVSAEKYTVFAAIRTKYPVVTKFDNHYGADVCWFGGATECLVGGGITNSLANKGVGISFGWHEIRGDMQGYGGLIQLKTADTGFIVMSLNNYHVWHNGRSDGDMLRTPNTQGRTNLEWSVPAINLTRLGGLPHNFIIHDADFPGDISEVLIYNQTLSAPERGMVEEYLLNKYSLAPATPVREAPALIARAAPVLQGLQLRLPGGGVYAIDIFTPRGARAGSFQFQAPGAFDLSHAGLSNGIYQIRVRAGADIFWLKAPVVR